LTGRFFGVGGIVFEGTCFGDCGTGWVASGGCGTGGCGVGIVSFWVGTFGVSFFGFVGTGFTGESEFSSGWREDCCGIKLLGLV
jgi:hypothetical protein